MRCLIAWGAGLLCAAGIASAQGEEPAEIPPLRNAGKPMVVEYHCTEEDTRLAGLSCPADDPCPVFLELASVAAAGNRMLAAGNIHSSTTTLSSVLLASKDDGKTWREPYERIRLAGLDHIQFIDDERGWIGGETQHPLPRDPFLLATTDGGKTWRAHPIFADPQFGSVLHFWFGSTRSGSLVIDRGRGGESGRYELYETPDAGETWMLRQTNQQTIQIKRAGGTADSPLRLRVDAGTKSYRIERREGSGWPGLAAFSVSIGACEAPATPAASVTPSETAPAAPRTPQMPE